MPRDHGTGRGTRVVVSDFIPIQRCLLYNLLLSTMKDYLDLYILTFNCARNPVPIDLFAEHFFQALPSSVGLGVDRGDNFGAPELIVLCLQEVAPVAYAFLGGVFLTPYLDAIQKAVNDAVSKRWNTTHYVNMVRDHSGMTALMVFVRSDVTNKISWVDTAQVGVGIQEMGNKGAVGARLGYLTEKEGEEEEEEQRTVAQTVDLTFVAAHLAPMEYNVGQRNDDWQRIVKGLIFSRRTKKAPARQTSRSSTRNGESEENIALLQDQEDHPTTPLGMFAPTAHLFFAGDLNYRTSETLSGKGDSARYPRPIQDTNSPLHYSQFLKRDQLLREMRGQKTLHGLSEAPIRFPPTYKYSAAARLAASDSSHQDGELNQWKWAIYRWPSWTDRILYLDTPSWLKEEIGDVQPHVYDALPLFPSSDHRAVALSVSVPFKSLRMPESNLTTEDVRLTPPFPLDPDWENKRTSARRKEIAVGYLAYLILTWQGSVLLLASILGGLGAWFVLRSLLEG